VPGFYLYVRERKKIMLTFIVGAAACCIFPPLIFGIIGYAIGGIILGVIGLIIGLVICS
jgi:hypothetical protein